ncbi:hypothetical protein NSP_18520 [Nodularia spumigena CCY9414]|nr:hypothetical protein NSP_18520 [Nodularia spumigena CCY9414]
MADGERSPLELSTAFNRNTIISNKKEDKNLIKSDQHKLDNIK